MTQIKHTTGPWEVVVPEVYENKNSVDIYHQNREIGAASLVVARVTVRQTWASEQLANARLIAAAPELLEALQIAVKQNEHDMLMTGEELRKALAAIAKATGA